MPTSDTRATGKLRWFVAPHR